MISYGVRRSNDRDEPACGVAAGLNFHDRTNHPRDERSIDRQGCLLATVLVITTAPRHFCISRLESWHVLSR
jgi:hypothetical protein